MEKFYYTVPQNSVLMWSGYSNKIRSKADAERMLTKNIHTNQYSFHIEVDEEKEYIIRKNDNEWEVCERYGDLKNPFTPEIRLSEDIADAVNIMYKYRKLFNTFFFDMEGR